MARFKEASFILIVFIFFFGVFLNMAFSEVSENYHMKSKSYLEGRQYQTTPTFSVKSLLAKEFQQDAEQFFADHILLRDNVLLANAGAQRSLIAFSANCFGYDNYPTFYDSHYVYCPHENALFEMPVHKDYFSNSYWSNLSKSFNEMVTNNPKVKEWRFALAPTSREVDVSPIHACISHSVDYSYLTKKFGSILPPEVQFVDLGISSIDEYLNTYNHSDHHWNMLGAINGYNKMIYSLNKSPVKPLDCHVAYDGQFFGSGAREGLIDSVWDTVYDLDYNRSNLKITIDGKPATYHDVDLLWNEDGSPFVKKDKFANISYHEKNYPLVEFENLDLDEHAGSLLLVADSFTDRNDKLFAESYKYVYIIDPRFYKKSLSTFIAEHSIENVAIVLKQKSLGSKAAAEYMRS